MRFLSNSCVLIMLVCRASDWSPSLNRYSVINTLSTVPALTQRLASFSQLEICTREFNLTMVRQALYQGLHALIRTWDLFNSSNFLRLHFWHSVTLHAVHSSWDNLFFGPRKGCVVIPYNFAIGVRSCDANGVDCDQEGWK